MLLCGLKLTHDGGVAVIDGQRLLFSVEMEKLDGNRRYQPLDRLDVVGEVLRREGIRVTDVDSFVVDGWFPAEGEDVPLIRVTGRDGPVVIETAPYCEPDALPRPGPLRRYAFPGLALGDEVVPYASYHHATQHVLGAYGTSPFAARGEASAVLVWDGGMAPRLYHVDSAPLRVTALGPLMPVYGSAFADYAAQFAPFQRPAGARDAAATTDGHAVPPHLDVAGKAMAYAALGRDETGFHAVLDRELAALPLGFETGTRLGRRIGRDREALWPGASDADLIATFQGYLGARLLSALREAVAKGGRSRRTPNLCLAGGCALNIKWNSAIRAAGLFREVWIPPFPNDSGAALGTAVAELVHHGGTRLHWDVCGPEILAEPAPAGWRPEPCDAAGLARLLHETGQPVVVLNGRAEGEGRPQRHQGPGELPTGRTDLSGEQGTGDLLPRLPRPLHAVRPHRPPRVAERIPAVVHLDGTARLQTVGPGDNPLLQEVLTAYERLSGVPVLCNTSANEKGRGFFPSVDAAARWGRTDAVWCSGLLYTRRP